MKRFTHVYQFMHKAMPFFMIWVSLLLMYGVICSYTNELGQDEFYRFIFFLRSPFVIAINVFAFIALLLNTLTYLYRRIRPITTDRQVTDQSLFKATPVVNFLVNLGGIWAALFSPVMMVVIAQMIPFGNAATVSSILKFSGQSAGKSFLLLMIALPIWYALHNILLWLYEMNIYPKRRKLFIYIVAIGWTLHALYILFLR